MHCWYWYRMAWWIQSSRMLMPRDDITALGPPLGATVTRSGHIVEVWTPYGAIHKQRLQIGEGAKSNISFAVHGTHVLIHLNCAYSISKGRFQIKKGVSFFVEESFLDYSFLDVS